LAKVGRARNTQIRNELSMISGHAKIKSQLLFIRVNSNPGFGLSVH